jgi:type IV secretion system protein VirB4
MVNLKRFWKAYRESGAFHSLLPPHRFVDEQVFLTKANALGMVLEVEGLDPECLTDETLESYTRRIAAAWRAFDDRFRLYQYLIKRDQVSIACDSSGLNPIVSATIRHRTEYLQTKPGGLYSIQIFYVVLFELGVFRGRHPFSNRKTLRRLQADLQRDRDTLVGHVEAFQRNISDLLGVTTLPKGDAFAFLRFLANLDPNIAGAERLKYDDHVDYFLPNLQLACTDDGIQLGDAALEILSLREPPSATYPNALRELLALEANVILCTEFKRVGNEKAISTIRAAQNHFHWSQWVSDIPSIVSMVLNRGKRENVIADKSALNDVEDLDRTLASVKNDGEYLGEFSFTVVLYGWKGRARLKSAAADVLKIFGNHEASLFQESFNALNAYLSIVPGNHVFNLRRSWLLNGNYADLSFLCRPDSGTIRNEVESDQLVVLETNDRTPFYFHLYEGDRMGALLFGAPGAGKSVLANLLIDHSQKNEPYTFILDLGGSYRQITAKHEGSYVEMGATIRAFRINPFVLPGATENIQFLFTFVRLLLTNGGYEPAVEDDRELFEAVEAMYVFAPEQRTLSNLAYGLPPHLRTLLQPWIGKGQYGSIFDNREDTLTFARFQTFDFQGMDELYPQVLEPLLFYIFHRISQIVYDPALVSSPKQLWADEVWRFLANDTARQYLVAAGKTWRKHNGGIGLITQSAADLQNAGVLDLVNEVCPTKLLLANPGADLGNYGRMFRLNERELQVFSELIPKRQFLLKTASRSKVLNVHLDPRAYWEYANSPRENERRRLALEEHGVEEGLKILAAQAS